MMALLLAIILLQVTPGPSGVATGIVRSTNGSPAFGVRVYAIPAGDPNVAFAGATVFESLVQTDSSGRYRLEIPAGRYYIAVGSVNFPTYYPDTTSVTSAKVISIAAGSTVESVDFSKYTVASSSPFGAISLPQPALPPGSTGVLSGVVRAADGAGVSGVTVHAVPVSVLSSPSTGPPSYVFTGTTSNQIVIYQQSRGALQQAVPRGRVTVTDNLGRYRIDNLTPDTYNIVAGFSDAPVFYPGTSDIQKATALTTTSSTILTTIDFTLPPPRSSFSIRGRISANDGLPVGGATLILQNVDLSVATGVGSLLPKRSYKPATSVGDGTFEIPDINPGKYSLQARLSGVTPLMKTVEIVDHAVNIDFDFSINVLSGRIVWEDGSPLSNSDIREVAVSTISNPNLIATTLVPVSSNGTFSGVIEPGDYRFYVRGLPADYLVRTMTSGTVNLMNEPLHVIADVPSPIVIRVAKGLNSGTRVRGRVLNAVTRSAAAADQVELCCFASGPFERLSAAILPDGSFEFANVPPGRYTAELRGKPGQTAAGILNQTIEIGDQEKSGILLVSATQTAFVTANVIFEGGVSPPSSAAMTVALTLSPGTSPSSGTQKTEEISIPMTRLHDGTYWTSFPTGVRYTFSIENIPEGYILKSISGPGTTTAISSPTVDPTKFSGLAPGVVSIVIRQSGDREQTSPLR